MNECSFIKYLKVLKKGQIMSKSNWNTHLIPELSDQVAIVTGSSSGIGYEAARVLANKNTEVILAVRNAEKGQKALNKID